MVRYKSPPTRSLKPVYHQPFSTILMYQADVQMNTAKHAIENAPSLAFRMHPLELSQHITLTPLQSAITTAILKCGEPSCHITAIYEFVGRRWYKIRGKDGSVYGNDYRKAVQACLRHHSNNIALFRKDPNDPKRWMLCTTLAESEETIRQEQERRLNRVNLSVGLDGTKMTMSLRPRDENRSEKGRKYHSSTTRPRSIHHNPYSRYRSFSFSFSFSEGSDEDDDNNNSNGNDTGMSDEENMIDINDDASKNSHSGGGSGNDDDFTPTRVDKEKSTLSNDNSAKENSFHSDAAQLTDLQRLISEAIILNGGSCHLDVIHDYVLKHWSKLKGRDGQPKNTDCRRAILASLSKNLYSHPLFTRDVKREGAWKMGSYNPLRNVTHLPPTGTEPPRLNTESNTLTDLQKLIIRAIGDKKVDFDTMLNFVSQRWQTLRRRDGSQYASNIKRAIQASLSNNSATMPIFKKEMGDEFGTKGLWSLTERGLELWRHLCEEDEKTKRTSSSPSTTAHSNVNSPTGTQDPPFNGTGSTLPDKDRMEFDEISDEERNSKHSLRPSMFPTDGCFPPQYSQPPSAPLRDLTPNNNQNGNTQFSNGHS